MVSVNLNIFAWRRQFFLLALCLIIFYLIFKAGIDSGTTDILPGPAMRSRDAIGIALSFLRNYDWLGFAAYKDVILELSANGITIDPIISLKNFGTDDYQSLLKIPQVTNNAISQAFSIELTNPNSLWFPDGDDIGLSIYFGIAFFTFGLKVSSLFSLFMAILAISAISYISIFWKYLQALIIAPIFLLVMKILIQSIIEIELDINSIVSSRFLPVLGFLAYTHILMMSLLKIQLKGCKQILFFVLQALIIVFLVIIRSSSVWMPLALFAIGLIIFISKLFSKSRCSILKKIPKLNPYPIVIFLALYLTILFCVTTLKHELFKRPPLVSQHVFWHPLITVLHNNPNRDIEFGIPKNLSADPLTDNLGYFLFERYLKEKGIERREFLIEDPEVSRLRGITYLWGTYDEILKRVFIENLIERPYYAAASFFWYQPLNILKTLKNFYKKHLNKFINIENLCIYFSLILIYQRNFFKNISIGLIGFSASMSIIPALMVAPQELRIMDMINSLTIFGAYLGIFIVFSIIDKLSKQKT